MNKKLEELIEFCEDNNYKIINFFNYSETYGVAIVNGEDFIGRRLEYLNGDWE